MPAAPQGHLAIGHTRHSPTGGPRWENAQPSSAWGLCTAWFTGSYPILIPDAPGSDLTPSATTRPPTLPLPNPEPEVTR
jgi:hypothetical protein